MRARHRTIRVRLTLSYGLLFLLCGALFLGLNYFLVRRDIDRAPDAVRGEIAEILGVDESDIPDRPPDLTAEVPPGEFFADTPFAVAEVRDAVERVRQQTVDDALRRLLIQSAIALGIMAGVSVGLGWLMAGRMLRPIHDITDTARHLSETTLHERINLDSPRDELKELADTFDGMLARLDRAFGAQRDFVANASHEMRTPLTIMRTELDVTVSDPDATREDFDRMAAKLNRAIDRSEALIDRLLALARSEGAIASIEVDLARVVADAVEHNRKACDARDIEIDLDLESSIVQGDPALLERLVANLVGNAAAYNEKSGWIGVETRHDNGHAQLIVSNTGPEVPADQVGRLFDRFERLDDSRSRATGGFGLGLSIVKSVVGAHDGEVHATPLPAGGLRVEVEIPTQRASRNATA